MKQIKILVASLLVASISLTSCSEDKDNDVCPKEKTTPTPEKTKSKTIEIKTTAEGEQSDPVKQTGDFVRFSFKEGKIVTNDDWDFAIRGRLIITNGKSDKETPYIFGENEPERKKDVQVTSIIGFFEDIKDIGGLVKTDWHKDYHYATGSYEPTSPAIAFESHTRNSSNSRQVWHLRSGKDRDKLILRPVVFIFQTQDGHVAKMVIEEMTRTNIDFESKEDITYSIKYYYNSNEKSISLDEKK